MYSLHIEEMARALVSSGIVPLKKLEKAKAVLAEQWKDKQAFVWTVSDVHTAANKAGRAIDDDEAREILVNAHNSQDAEQGMNWGVLQELVGDAGRPLTEDEEAEFFASGQTTTA